MKLKTGSIQITTDGFTATTFIELEFFNHHIAEIEGLFRFQLQPEQIITAFQLDLHGKYRDGTIEEKWKATNAYNRIVGKRIDPALLTKEYDNNYNLRIYPVPAKQSRKVTITIQQALKDKNGMLEYLLPFLVTDTVENFSVSVTAYNNMQAPKSTLGLVNNEPFIYSKNNWMLTKQFASIVLNKPIQFEWQLLVNPFYCTKTTEGKNYFALRFQPKADSIYQLHPTSAHVFWDVSSSGSYRNTEKEISFLKQYFSFHKVQTVTLVTFNHELIDTLVFTSANTSWTKFAEYLRNLNYEGGTRLSRLNFSKIKSDVVFLFSDGKSSLGSRLPVAGKKPVFTVSTSAITDSSMLSKIAGSSGGTYLQLQRSSIGKAIQNASVAVNYLVDILSSGKSIFESQLNAKLNKPLLIYGTSLAVKDTITFLYGNSSASTGKEKMVLDYANACTHSAIDRLNMLMTYEQMMQHYNWNDILDFGLTEKVVTPYTAYIVLELIEHYIQYNIAPPKELEEECRQRGFVKKDTRAIRNKENQSSQDEMLRSVVAQYNQRVIKWDKKEKLVWYQPIAVADISTQATVQNSRNSDNGTTALQGKAAGVDISGSNQSLQEVVVVGYGVATKRSLGYAVSTLSSKQIEMFNGGIGQILAGRVPGLNVTGSTGFAGSSANIRIRGASSFSASAQPLFILDGVPINGNPDQIINPNDIESISVLRDAAGTAIYGSQGANGVIIITTKRGRNYGRNYNQSYALKNMPDVDYLVEMKETPIKHKLQKLEQLKGQYKNDAGFYLDMAEHLYQYNFKTEAVSILMEATELYPGKASLLTAVAYLFEIWNESERALEIYEELAEQYPEYLEYQRNLAGAYFGTKQYQKAVDVLYKAVCTEASSNAYYYQPTHVKSMLLHELSNMIQLYKDSLKLDAINPSLIKPMPCDLRIVVEENAGAAFQLKINEPGLGNWASGTTVSKHGGYINNSGYYNQGQLTEYILKDAIKGKYKIWVNYYSGHMYTGKIPAVIRITIYKNFGKPNQKIETKTVMMDNQYGEIEIGEVSW